MNIECFTSVLFRRLKKTLQHPGTEQRVDELARDLFPLQGYHQDHVSLDDEHKLTEGIVNLERKGLLVRGHYSRLPNVPAVWLTSVGIKSGIDDDVLILVDKPEEIVAALEQKIGGLDDVVRQYYLESIRACQEGLYIASVICLGAASERAIHCLAEALAESAPDCKSEIERKQRGRSAIALIQYLSDVVIPKIFGDDKHFQQQLRERLEGLGNVYRENRNEAGHPETLEQGWLNEDQECLLLQFRRYITTISEAVTKSRDAATN